MKVEQALQQEFKDSELCLVHMKNLFTNRISKKRFELIDWVLQNIKNPNVEIAVIEVRMNETIQEINEKKFNI